jgi:hypothetical protein
MSRVPADRVLRKTLKWLLLLAVVGFVLFRLRFAPMPVVAHGAKSVTVARFSGL